MKNSTGLLTDLSVTVAIGKFLYGELIPDRTLSDTIDFSDEKENEKEKENFLSFVKLMLTWLPEERKTAKELMEHPFLGWGKDIS